MGYTNIRFTKLQGLGNDFVLIDNRAGRTDVTPALARALADRRLGIGCDQVLIIEPPVSPGALCAYRIWNADGSGAEQCGNGARCIALWLHHQGEMVDAARLDSPAGAIEVRYQGGGQVEAELSEPGFEPEKVNRDWRGPPPWLLEIAGRRLNCYGASLGNPHVLIVADEFSRDDLAELGEAINQHPAFPQGANVGLGEISDAHTLRLSVFERGAGLTSACGSGAAAAAAMLMHAGKMQNPVTVNQLGGALVIQWQGPGRRIKMTGPARHVFHGEFEWNTTLI